MEVVAAARHDLIRPRSYYKYALPDPSRPGLSDVEIEVGQNPRVAAAFCDLPARSCYAFVDWKGT